MIHTYIEFKFEIYVNNKAIWVNGEFEQFSLRHQSFQLLNLFKFRPNFDKMIKIVFFSFITIYLVALHYVSFYVSSDFLVWFYERRVETFILKLQIYLFLIPWPTLPQLLLSLVDLIQIVLFLLLLSGNNHHYQNFKSVSNQILLRPFYTKKNNRTIFLQLPNLITST